MGKKSGTIDWSEFVRRNNAGAVLDYNGSNWNGHKVLDGSSPSNGDTVETGLHTGSQVANDAANGSGVSVIKNLFEEPIQYDKNRTSGTDIVIHDIIPRKSNWGKTGKFDVNKPYDIYERMLLRYPDKTTGTNK